MYTVWWWNEENWQLAVLFETLKIWQIIYCLYYVWRMMWIWSEFNLHGCCRMCAFWKKLIRKWNRQFKQKCCMLLQRRFLCSKHFNHLLANLFMVTKILTWQNCINELMFLKPSPATVIPDRWFTALTYNTEFFVLPPPPPFFYSCNSVYITDFSILCSRLILDLLVTPD